MQPAPPPYAVLSSFQHHQPPPLVAPTATATPAPAPAQPAAAARSAHRSHVDELSASSSHTAKLYGEIATLRQEAEAREFVVNDLRSQVSGLLRHQQDAAALRQQLGLLDERVRARDLAQQARLEELNAKVQLHASVESQLEAQVIRLEEERLGVQRRMGEAVDAAERRAADAEARLRDADGRFGTAAAELSKGGDERVRAVEHRLQGCEAALAEERARTSELRAHAH
jgi:chromosome segregation ATPase